jgi:hypothetical protein
MRKWREITAGKYLRAADYELGDCFPVTQEAARDEEGEWRDDEKFKTVLTLNHYPAGEKWGDLVPNVTSLKTLRRLFGGEDPSAANGKQYEVVVVDTMFGNGFQIRALSRQPAQAAPSPSPRPEFPAANTRPQAQHQLSAGSGQDRKDDLDEILGGDEIPTIDSPQPAAAVPPARKRGRPPKSDAQS